MKKMITSLLIAFAAISSINAMNYQEAAGQARYLTDKMAYELNLNDQQYNDCYEINLDYLLSIETADDVYGNYLAYRNADLRHILLDWQYMLFAAADYFFHPVYWRAGVWHYPIYRYYAPGYFYYSHPAVYGSYRGGHGRFHYNAGFYASRRPQWHGGFRGHDRTPVANHSSHRDNHRGRSGSYQGNHNPSHNGRSYNHPSSTRSTVHNAATPSAAGRSSSGVGSTRGSSVAGRSSSGVGSTRSSSGSVGSRSQASSGRSAGSSAGSIRGNRRGGR